MASSTCCILILLAFVVYDQSFVEAACPLGKGQAEKEMKRCLNSVGLGGMESGGGTPNWAEFKQHCSDGSLNQALDCAKGILDECKASDDNIAKALNKAISIDKLRQGFDYICDNLDVLEKNQACFGDATQPMGVCVEAETRKFQSDVQARSQSGQQMTEDDVWEMTCGLLDKVFACQHTAFKEACNDEVAEVIITFSQSVRPPVCGTGPFNGSPSFKSSTSIKLVFSALFLLIVLHFKS